MAVVYLIHFSRPFRHARHYLGYAENLEGRLTHHKNGDGAKLMRHVTEAGIEWSVVRKWEGATKTDERRIKNSRHMPRYCPVCREQRNAKRRKH